MGARILVVDDSPVLRSQIRQILGEALEVETFYEAEDGLQAFKLLVER